MASRDRDTQAKPAVVFVRAKSERGFCRGGFHWPFEARALAVRAEGVPAEIDGVRYVSQETYDAIAAEPNLIVETTPAAAALHPSHAEMVAAAKRDKIDLAKYKGRKVAVYVRSRSAQGFHRCGVFWPAGIWPVALHEEAEPVDVDGVRYVNQEQLDRIAADGQLIVETDPARAAVHPHARELLAQQDRVKAELAKYKADVGPDGLARTQHLTPKLPEPEAVDPEKPLHEQAVLTREPVPAEVQAQVDRVARKDRKRGAKTKG